MLKSKLMRRENTKIWNHPVFIHRCVLLPSSFWQAFVFKFCLCIKIVLFKWCGPLSSADCRFEHWHCLWWKVRFHTSVEIFWMQSSKAISRPFMGSVCRFSRGGGPFQKTVHPCLISSSFTPSDRSLGARSLKAGLHGSRSIGKIIVFA